MPLEAMRMGLPLFASDRDFVRSVCGDVPIYFDPEDVLAAAEVLARALRDPDGLAERARRGAVWVGQLPTAAHRAHDYAAIVSEELS